MGIENNSAPSSRAGRALGLAIFLLALLLRLIYIYQIRHNPFFASPILDAEIYDHAAEKIAQGDWVGQEVFFQAPLYSYFLGLIYYIFGHQYLLPRLVQAFLSALSVWLVYRLGRRVFDFRVGVLGGLIFALYGPHIYFTGELLIHTLDIFLILLFLNSLDGLLKRGTSGSFLRSGLLFGLCALSRPTILLYFPVVLIWMAWRWRDQLKRLPVFIAGAFVIILPVTIRNYWVGRDFVLISAQAGVNFYMGNNPWSNGHTAWVPGTPKDWWAEGYSATQRIAERAAGRQLKPSEISSYWFHRTLEGIRSKPLVWASVMLKKVRLLLAGHEISNTEDIYFQSRFSSLLRSLLWEKVIAFPFGLLLPLALFGLAFAAHRGRQSHLILFQACYALTVILFFVTARYRLALAPVFCLWAAAGIFELQRILRARQVWRYGPALAALVLLVIIMNRNPLRGEEAPGLDGAINLGNKYLQKNEPALALDAFHQAAEIAPYSFGAANGAANALLKLGRAVEAREAFKKAVLYEPSVIPPHNNLARLLDEDGDLAGARRQYEIVLSLDSCNVYALQGLADLKLKERDYSAAENYYRRAFEQGAADRQVISRWATTLLQQQKFAAALSVNAKLLALEPRNARAHHNQARIYIACDSLAQAATELEIVLKLAPETLEARQQLEQICNGQPPQPNTSP